MHRDLFGDKAFVASQFDRERKYWLEKLAGELPETGFPADFTVGVSTEKRKTHRFQLPRDIFERLTTISNNSDSRLYMLLVTGLNLLLYKYTGQTDIMVATPIEKQEVEGELFNTVLALRNRIDEQMPVKEFLLQVRQGIIEARQHQNYPIETLCHDLNLTIADNHFPLFDTAILLENIQDIEYLRHIPLSMIFSFLNTGESLEGTIDYDASLFEETGIARIIDHYIHLLRETFNQVELKLMDIPLLTEQEKTRLVMDFNGTAAEYPREKMIQQLFEEQVQKTPANTAVESGDKIMTYEAVNSQTNQLARLLREKGIGANITATIMLESSPLVIIAVLAVLKAGGAYLPMGFEYPEDRIDYLLEDSGAKILLTRESLLENKTLRRPTIHLEDETLYRGDRTNLEPVNNSRDLAYIIYTSGTTGQPKGVMIEHRSLVNYIWWAAGTYVKDEKTAFPLYTSISFDLTVTSIFTPLITGNTIIVYGGVDKKFYIEDVISDNRAAVVKLTPSHLKLIAQKNIKNSTIKRLVVGGEELETQLARDIYRNFPGGIEIYNEYGPTETTVGSMIYRFDPEADQRHSVPIGIPIANTRVYLLNRHNQPVPVGVVGEIYTAGDGLARGYFHNPALTGEKFIPDPFMPGQKMYKTGDLGIRLANGNIEYKGRIDHQVKIRGYRVETGEIETRILQFQRMTHARREQKENIVEKLDLKSIKRCRTCLIPVNYPGGIHFDEQGTCDICREFSAYKDNALAYFKTVDDFHRVVEEAQKTKKSKYDCLMLYSGGKDSSYVLHRLKEMGLNVLAFTFDNGYISAACWKNIERTTSLLKVDHVVKSSAAMKEIFVESLWSDYNVCNGCFKAVNTFGTHLAHQHNINLVVSGLTRGQIFDIKLHGLFKLGTFTEDAIEERLKLFRQNYHAMTHRTSRLINVEITNDMLEQIYFADYFRYDNISTANIYEYLKKKDKNWVRPTDTGASSSNCIINDVGIYVHLKDRGCHFYAAQLSWDCRLGTLTRNEGIEELTGFKADYPQIRRVLDEIGYYDAFTGAVVTAARDEQGEKALCAYILADKTLDISQLRAHLARELPDYMIPTYFTRIDRIPLTPSGKVDRKALPQPELNLEGEYTAPRDDIEMKLVMVWAELLGIAKESIGIDTNFFEVGGHSLRATFLAAAINKKFNIKIQLVKIFERPTIRGLAEYIKETAAETFTAIRPIEQKEYYPLSPAQSRLYILQQLDPDSTAYNIDIIVQVESSISKEKLKNAFMGVIHRHESLRTSFHITAGEPVQKIHDEVAFEIEYHEVEVEKKEVKVKVKVEDSDLEGTRGLAPLPTEPAGVLISSFIRPFDLSLAPLVRVGLITLPHTASALRGHRHFSQEGKEKGYLLMVSMHHIITDGLSHRVLLRDLLAFYNGGDLPALALRYKDYAQWQQSRAVQEALQRQEQYWLDQFQGEIPLLDMPSDYPRPGVQSFAGDNIGFAVSAGEAKALAGLAGTGGATLFMALLAIYNIFLAKITGQEDIIIGIDTAGRHHPDLQPMIGMFVNTLALRNFPAPGKTFYQFLQEIKEKSLKAFENQDYQFENLVDRLSVTRDTSRNPIFDVFFSHLDIDPRADAEPAGETGAAALKIKPYKYESRTAMFDLTLDTKQVEDNLFFSFEYCTKLFKRETIYRFINYFKQIMALVIANPHRQIQDIEIISGEEKKQILFEFNDTKKPIERDKNYSQLYEEQVVKTPDKTAAVSDDLHLTYRELDEHANGIAQILSDHGVSGETNALTALYLERSPLMLAAIIGTFKAGAAYVPLETNDPPNRLKDILEDSKPHVLITTEKLSEKIKKTTPPTIKSYLIEPGTIKSFCGESRGAVFSKRAPLAAGGKLAYLIYTSGSTGRPKGVMIHQAGMINHLYAKISDLAVTAEDVIAQTASASFDISVWQFLAGLLKGASVIIVGREIVLEPRRFLRVLQRGRVTILESVPSLLAAFLDSAVRESDYALPYLRWMVPTGEPLTPHLVREWYRHYPGIPLVNAYGPTEASDDVTHYFVKEIPPETQTTIPIGKPLQNLHIYVLDKHLSLCPVGIRGEICVAGIGVGKGYWKDEQKTLAAFIPNPFLEEIGDEDYAVIYKTGDIGYYREDGTLECLGRMDSQVKIRGNRIELGEIEKQLNNYPGIKEAVVIDRADSTGNKYLTAYVVSDSPGVLSSSIPGELTAYLVQALPGYMVPSHIMELEKLPLTANGKIDRKALPEPEIETAAEYIPPANPEEEKLAEIWADLLGIGKEKVGANIGFFDLGGHSLRAALLAARIQQAFKVKLPLVEVFKTPTIRGLAQYIHAAARDSESSVEPAEKKEYYPLSPAQKRIYLIQQVDFENIAYNIVNVLISEEPLDRKRLEETFRRLIRRHESLRTSIEIIAEEAVQRIHPQVEFDIEDLATEDTENTELSGFIRPFDLSKAPLLRVVITAIDDGKHLLIVDMHHMITDGVSHALLIQEFTALYAGEDLPGLRLQYRDFSQWQQGWRESGRMTKQEAFWLEEFAHDMPVLTIPTDFPRPAQQDFAGDTIGFTIGSNETGHLKNLAKSEEATLFMVLLAVYYVLLSRLSGQEDIVVGTGMAGRHRPGLENIIGMFVNTLALRNYPRCNQTFREFVRQVKERTLKALENQDYPFENLVEKVVKKKDFSRNPLFDTVFVQQNPTGIKEIPISKKKPLKLKPYEYNKPTSQFDINFNSRERGEELEFTIVYRTRLFKKETMEMFADFYRQIITRVIENPGIQLKDIYLANEVERMQVSLQQEHTVDFDF